MSGLHAREVRLLSVVSALVNAVVDTLSLSAKTLSVGFLTFFSLTHGTALLARLVSISALDLVAAVVDVGQVLAIFANTLRSIVYKRLMEFILNVQRSAESVLLGLTDGDARVVVGMVGVLSGIVLHKALAFAHVGISGISAPVGHE